MATLFSGKTTIVGYARVAVERGVDRFPDGLTYAIADGPLADLQPGERVKVPLGKGNTLTAGYIVDIAGSTDQDVSKLKEIHRRDESGAKLPSQLISLARWISSYYCSPIGMTLATMLPAAVKKNIGSVKRTMLDMGDPLPLGEKLPAKQRHVLEVLANLPAQERPIELRELAAKADLKTIGPIRKLIDRKLIEPTRRTIVEAAWSEHARDSLVPERLTPDQSKVINDIAGTLQKGFSTHLLYGVTGSGKTEVYIRLIERVIAQGKVAMLLVPEISLTPQTGGRIIGRFPHHRLVILHSGLTAAQRHQQWAQAAAGGAEIILGARSAIFAPIPDDRLGLIIVDEEHDGSYKQDQVPRYHGRDVAIKRAQLADCTVLLGSATPSLESWHNATIKRSYALHRLDHRVPGMRLPRVQVVDFAEQRKQRKDRHVHLIGPVLEAALAQTLEGGGQALILLNRRGYANYIACPSQACGWVMTCGHCDVTLVYHQNKKLPGTAGGFVRCHHCLEEQRLPELCPQCGRHITTFGLGTQRVEEELARKFPQLIDGETMKRVDSDSMHGSRDFHDTLARFGAGEIKLLVGTQMIAKGLDYPAVRLVGVINADTAINLPDFRAAERTFQLVSQVAGRCGRSMTPGETGLAIVQTFSPDAPSIRLAAAHDYEGFAHLEMAERQRCALPPFTRMARIVVRNEDHVTCIAAAKQLADRLRGLADPTIRIRGPAPCPIARIADKHRQQVEILAPSPGSLQTMLASARSAGLIRAGAEMAIDVDPIALL